MTSPVLPPLEEKLVNFKRNPARGRAEEMGLANLKKKHNPVMVLSDSVDTHCKRKYLY
jgi:hypothetical protein